MSGGFIYERRSSVHRANNIVLWRGNVFVLVGYAMKIELDPCPFCGSLDVVDHIVFKQKIIFIKCCSCGCTGPKFELETSEKSVVASVDAGLKKASECWNKREF